MIKPVSFSTTGASGLDQSSSLQTVIGPRGFSALVAGSAKPAQGRDGFTNAPWNSPNVGLPSLPERQPTRGTT